MSHAPPDPSSNPNTPLEADLQLVLQGRSAAAKASQVRKWIDVQEVATALSRARGPAIAGIETLSIEAQRLTIELAEQFRAKLFLGIEHVAAVNVRRKTMQTASLGHVFDCELILWVGTNGDAGDLERRIAREQLRGSFVGSDLATVQKLRRIYRDNPNAEPLGQYARVAVVIAPDCDERVVSQWHRFAADIQPHTRLCVIQLPGESAMNRRGAIETACWQTGLSLEAGGIDFADGAPRRCPQLAASLRANAIDLLIDFGCESPDIENTVTHLKLPANSLCRPSRSRVMRCDGIVLWLKQPVAEDDPQDEASIWLKKLAAELGATS